MLLASPTVKCVASFSQLKGSNKLALKACGCGQLLEEAASSFLAVTTFSMLCGCILGIVFVHLGWRLCARKKHFPRESVFSLLVGIALNICPFCLCSLSIMAGMLHTCDSMHSIDLEEAVSELLSHLDLEHAALTGDLTILRELQHAECVDKIHDVNKMYKFTAEEWESERVSHSPAVPSYSPYAGLHRPDDRSMERTHRSGGNPSPQPLH